VRTLCCGLLLAALGAGTAAAQAPAAGQAPAGPTQTSTSQTAITQDEIVLQGDTTPRGALPTIYGDTGLWFVPTAETLPAGRFSFSVYRANWDRPQGLTDVNQIGVTAAAGVGRLELFGSWHVVRLDRDLRPTFIPSEPEFGGVSHENPYVRRGWSKTLGGPVVVGGKVNLVSQSRGDALSLAPRVMIKFPTGADWASTNDWDYHFDLIASREFGKSFELTGNAGGVLRGDPDEFQVSDGFTWGVGATFPTRSKLRALAEFTGEWVIDKNTAVLNPPLIAEDGSVAPILSRIHDPADFKLGAVWQATSGMFVHGGFNYTQGVGTRTIGGREIEHHGWGFDIRLGWHPGVTPARERQHIIKETTTVTNTITQPAPAANRVPVFNATVACDPCILEPGGQSRLSASATDPEGGAVTYRWTAPSGSFNPTDGANTTFTAPAQEGNVPVTVTAQDSQGAQATASLTLQVVRREVIEFEDVHFDFDRFNLRPDALKILDDAVAKMQRNPNVRITIEGHCDSIGTSEYNLALGERRANSVRDYLTNRGIMNTRMRTVSYGEDRPISDNNTAQGRAQNRRAHLVVIMETVQ
jgi:peptidoglycan-associated lipoprotein